MISTAFFWIDPVSRTFFILFISQLRDQNFSSVISFTCALLAYIIRLSLRAVDEASQPIKTQHQIITFRVAPQRRKNVLGCFVHFLVCMGTLFCRRKNKNELCFYQKKFPWSCCVVVLFSLISLTSHYFGTVARIAVAYDLKYSISVSEIQSDGQFRVVSAMFVAATHPFL